MIRIVHLFMIVVVSSMMFFAFTNIPFDFFFFLNDFCDLTEFGIGLFQVVDAFRNGNLSLTVDQYTDDCVEK